MLKQWILPLELEPKGPSFVFDEPDVQEIQNILKQKEATMSWNIEMISHIHESYVSNLHIQACVQYILKDIVNTQGYHVVHVEANTIMYIGNKRFIMDLITYIQKPSRAYARAIKMNIGYEVDSDIIVLFSGDVIGFVSDDHINGLHGFDSSGVQFMTI